MSKKIVFALRRSGTLRNLAAAVAEIASGDRYRKVPYLERRDAAGELAQAIEKLRQALVSGDGAVAEQEADREQQEQRRALLETFVAKFERATSEVQNAVASAAMSLRAASSSLTDQAGVVSTRSQAIGQSAAAASRDVVTLATAASELDGSLAGLEGRRCAHRRDGRFDFRHYRSDPHARAERHHRSRARR
jgi:nitrogen fixation/metabolism regulation signal transduction histidine kinase